MMLCKSMASAGLWGKCREASRQKTQCPHRNNRELTLILREMFQQQQYLYLSSSLQSQFSKSKLGEGKGFVKNLFFIECVIFWDNKTNSEPNALPVNDACSGRPAVAVSLWGCFPTRPFTQPSSFFPSTACAWMQEVVAAQAEAGRGPASALCKS